MGFSSESDYEGGLAEVPVPLTNLMVMETNKIEIVIFEN